MKFFRLYFFASAIVLTGMLLFLDSCDSKRCEDVLCEGNSICNPSYGECFCVDGFEGSDCLTDATTKYIGSYLVSTFCPNGGGGAGTYTVYINQGFDDVNHLTINNLFNSGLTYDAYIYTNTENKGNIISIPYQQQGATDASGEGNFYESLNQIIMQLNYTQGFDYNECELTFYKQ